MRGCIKAELINKKGDSITACRSIEALSRHGGASKFKTIDNTLTKKNKRTGVVMFQHNNFNKLMIIIL